MRLNHYIMELHIDCGVKVQDIFMISNGYEIGNTKNII